jgi:hypothetical protein
LPAHTSKADCNHCPLKPQPIPPLHLHSPCFHHSDHCF